MSQNNFQDDKIRIIEYYEKRLKQYGITPQTMSWRDKEQQYMRFAILSEIGDLNRCSVLDAGCGFGDFYSFLKDRRIKVEYAGCDIVPKLVKIAEKKHPQAIFKVGDILKENFSKKFDYVIFSGVFSLKLNDSENFAKEMLKRAFGFCRIGIAFNMISSYVDYQDKYLYYYQPEEIFAFCKSLSKRVTLRHDYMPYEFTIYLYKQTDINDRNIFKQRN